LKGTYSQPSLFFKFRRKSPIAPARYGALSPHENSVSRREGLISRCEGSVSRR
jgi:hypothetical protein